MLLKHRITLALALAFVSAASAAAPQASEIKTPPVMAAAIKAGMTVNKSFPAASGLTGWVISDSSGQYSVIYTTADGQSLISGLLLDAQGTNLTRAYSEKYVPKPDYAKALSAVEGSTWVATGAKQPKSVIYVFMDPNCPFCHLAGKAFKPYEKAGLQVRWIPVGFENPTSAGKAAAILESKDPSKAMSMHMDDYDMRTQNGGIAPLADSAIKAATAGHLQENMVLMGKLGFKGTPAILYKDKEGKAMAAGGMPKLSELPGITGLPEQPVTDPDLQRFR